MEKDYLDEVMSLFDKRFGGSTKEDLIKFGGLSEADKKKFIKEKRQGLSTEDRISFLKELQELAEVKEREVNEGLRRIEREGTEALESVQAARAMRLDTSISASKTIRNLAYSGNIFFDPLPSDTAILQAYPHVSENPLVTLLTLGFNKVVNKRREKAYEEKDKQEFSVTGMTTALKIYQDKELQKLDKKFIEKLKRESKERKQRAEKLRKLIHPW